MRIPDDILLVVLGIEFLLTIENPVRYHNFFVELTLFVVAAYTVINGGSHGSD